MSIIYGLPWSSQPQTTVRLNQSHWLAKDLIIAVAGNIAISRYGNLTPVVRTLQTASKRARGNIGNGLHTIPDGSGYIQYTIPESFNGNGITLSCWGLSSVAAATTDTLLATGNASASHGGVTIARNTAEQWYSGRINSAGAGAGSICTNVTNGKWEHIANRQISASETLGYVNGVEGAVSSGNFRDPGTQKDVFIGTSIYNISTFFNPCTTVISAIGFPMVIDRLLSPDEIIRLYDEQRTNPWQLFAPIERNIFVGAALEAEVGNAVVQILRPSEDIVVGSWQPSAGTSLFDTVNETPYSDTDYMFTTTASTAELRLTAGNAPSAGPIIIRYRAKNNGNGNLVAYLYQGATLKATHTPTLTSDFTSFTWELSAGEISSLSDFTDLRVKFTSS